MSIRSACRSAKTAGRLRHFATIETPSTPTDGETKPTWTNLATSVPMSRQFVRAQETVSGDRVQGIPVERVMMSFRPDVNETMRLRFATTGTDDVLEIVGLGDPIGDRRWLEVTCRRIAST